MGTALSLLAVFAHPDDESCGPGATLAMYARRGVELGLVCVTRGEQGICDDPACEDYQPVSRDQAGTIRLQELAGACKALGIRHWAVLGYPDGRLVHGNNSSLEAELVKWIRTLRPQVIVTCCPEGEAGHPDHDTVARVTTRAYLGAGHARRFPYQLREGLTPWQPLKLYYAIPPDPELASKIKTHRPLTVVDTSAYVEAKLQAMRCHVSQKECSETFAAAVHSNPRCTESFYLAHSRLPSLEGSEDDLFAGVAAGAATRESAR